MDPFSRRAPASNDNRSLIARLGFSDPDRCDQTHDLACQYLSLPDSVRKIVDLVQTEYYRPIRSFQKLSYSAARIEVPISKGNGQYKTTIGFVDILLEISPMFAGVYEDAIIAVEVKTGRAGMGQVVRQINLYREFESVAFGRPVHWILATTYPETDANVDQLREADIFHVELGVNFAKWCESQADQPMAKSCVI